MALKTVGKSNKSDIEKEVRIAMIHAEVTQVDIGRYEGVSGAAINNRLARLNASRAREMLELIKRVAAWKQSSVLSKPTG